MAYSQATSHAHGEPSTNSGGGIVFSQAIENVPPQAPEAEQAVLGCCMLDMTTAALDVARSHVTAASFYRQANRAIWEAILSLDEKGEPVDLLTVAQELEERGKLEIAGGKPYLIACRESVPAVSKCWSYSKRVARAALRRQMIDYGGQIIGMAYDEEIDVEDAVQQAEGMVMGLARKEVTQGLVHVSEFLGEAWNVAEQAAMTGKGLVGMTTGFSELDTLTCGLSPASLAIVAGRPGMGKSSWAIGGLGYSAAKATGEPVAIFSLEMSKLENAFRLLSFESRIDSSRIRSGYMQTHGMEEDSPDDWEALAAAMGRLSDMPLYLDDQCGISTLEIRSRARRLKSEKGLGMVIVDYIQLIRSRNRGFSRHDEVTQIARDLKQMARELKVPVVALSQLSRQVERQEDKRPTLSSLLDSGSLEAESDYVFLLYRPKYYDPDYEFRDQYDQTTGEVHGEPFEVNLAKNRMGPTGMARLNAVLRYGLFREWEDRHQDPREVLTPVGYAYNKPVYDEDLA